MDREYWWLGEESCASRRVGIPCARCDRVDHIMQGWAIATGLQAMVEWARRCHEEARSLCGVCGARVRPSCPWRLCGSCLNGLRQ